MSKKNRKRGQPGPMHAQVPSQRPMALERPPDPGPAAAAQPRPDAVLAAPDAPGQPVSPELPAREAGPPDPSRKYFLIFWVVIFLAAAAASLLAIVWPGVSESIIERWMMAALAVSLAVFLFFYK